MKYLKILQRRRNGKEQVNMYKLFRNNALLLKCVRDEILRAITQRI